MSDPILVLWARDRESEKIAALDLGADDYVNKPFGIGELTARLRTALRHAAEQASEQTRSKPGRSPELILTEPGIGYRLNVWTS